MAKSAKPFLQRNTSMCPRHIKAQCYTTYVRPNLRPQTLEMAAFTHLDSDMFLCLFKAFVRPQLEYAYAAWSPPSKMCSVGQLS